MVESLPANAGDPGSSPGMGGSHMPRIYIYIFYFLDKKFKDKVKEIFSVLHSNFSVPLLLHLLG